MPPAATRTAPPHATTQTWSHGFQDDLVHTVATAVSIRAAIADLGALLLRRGAVRGIEWWSEPDRGSPVGLRLRAGTPDGARATIELGPAGRLVLIGASGADLVDALAFLRPLLRLRWSEDQLAGHASRLARKTEALDDFAGLVAHDVKSSLIAALRDEDPREGLTRALGLVDSILEAVRAEQGATNVAELEVCVRQAIADLGERSAEIVAHVTGEFPIPPDALRLILRNLLANAVAAGAEQIHVSALARAGQRVLVVDDDGVGLGATDSYAAGAQLGLCLCRRLVERCGGVLELRPRAVRGTRAMIVARVGAT